MAASAVAECTFVRDQLKLIGFESLGQLFKDNEIDKEAFLLLDGLALTTLIPGKMGIQLKILSHIQKLQVNEKKRQQVGVVNDRDKDKPPPKPRVQVQGHGQAQDRSKSKYWDNNSNEVSSKMNKNDRFETKNKGQLNGHHQRQQQQKVHQSQAQSQSQIVIKPKPLLDIDTRNIKIAQTPVGTTDIKMAIGVNCGQTATSTASPKPNIVGEKHGEDKSKLLMDFFVNSNKSNENDGKDKSLSGYQQLRSWFQDKNKIESTSQEEFKSKSKPLIETDAGTSKTTKKDGFEINTNNKIISLHDLTKSLDFTKLKAPASASSNNVINVPKKPVDNINAMGIPFKKMDLPKVDLVPPYSQIKNKISIQDLAKALELTKIKGPNTNAIQPSANKTNPIVEKVDISKLFRYPDHVDEKTNQIDLSVEKVDNSLSKIEHLMPNFSLDKRVEAKPKKIPNKIVKHRESLPIFGVKDKLIELIRKNQIVVVVGETGSGKSTQIPQYLLEHEFAKTAKIACTEPRRLAAESLGNSIRYNQTFIQIFKKTIKVLFKIIPAKRAALEQGCELGDKIGFKIRFKNETSAETLLIYMTDGMLLNEITRDPLLYNYSVIILDEAHERNINTDISFGLIKLALKKRPDDLKLIISSATLNTKKFASYFYNAPIFDICGRTFPVEVIYCGKPEPDYITKSIQTVCKIHSAEELGDILLFLTGQDEIEQAIDMLMIQLDCIPSRYANGYEIYPCYASLASEYQQEIFNTQQPGIRKIVVATNIAETSITIDGVAFVVDSGVVKVNVYNPRTGVSSLEVQEISKAQADQRKGRAGRTKAGKCYRLYSSWHYDAFKEISIPEIQRRNVDSVILHLVSVGIQDVVGFDFLDSPSRESIITALNLLQEIGAVDLTNNLTHVGRQMVKFPLDPTMAKSLIVSESLYCSEEMIILVSMLSARTEKLFIKNKKQRMLSEQSKNRFKKPEGDQITYIDVFKQWRQNNFSKSWCSANFLQSKTLEEAEEIRNQIVGLMDENNIRITSCRTDYSAVQKALCSGFFRNIAVKSSTYGYKIIGKTDTEQVFIHPGSVLFKDKPDYLLFHEVVKTRKAYMRDVIEIKREWVEMYAREFYTRNAASFFIREFWDICDDLDLMENSIDVDVDLDDVYDLNDNMDYVCDELMEALIDNPLDNLDQILGKLMEGQTDIILESELDNLLGELMEDGISMMIHIFMIAMKI